MSIAKQVTKPTAAAAKRAALPAMSKQSNFRRSEKADEDRDGAFNPSKHKSVRKATVRKAVDPSFTDEELEQAVIDIADKVAETWDVELEYRQSKNKRTWVIDGTTSDENGNFKITIFVVGKKLNYFRVKIENPKASILWNLIDRKFETSKHVINFMTFAANGDDKLAAAVPQKEWGKKDKPDEGDFQ